LLEETVCSYELRRRRHNRELINKTSRLADSNFIVRMIYKDMHSFVSFLYLSLCYFAFWHSLINEYDDDHDDDDDELQVYVQLLKHCASEKTRNFGVLGGPKK